MVTASEGSFDGGSSMLHCVLARMSEALSPTRNACCRLEMLKLMVRNERRMSST